MNNVKVIKTAHEHEAALERIAELMEADPREGTSEANGSWMSWNLRAGRWSKATLIRWHLRR